MCKSKILQGKECPYCGDETQFIDSSFVYGKSYGMIYICKACDAYCGVHKGTNKSLGRLANKNLRRLKQKAHKYFDSIWKQTVSRGLSKQKSRRSAYKWLAKNLDIDVKNCHIGFMDEETCKRVIDICKPHYEIIKKQG